MKFIKANDKIINLQNVSSVNFLPNRIAFDFNCPVQLDSGKLISYYAYDDKGKKEDLLKNTFVKSEFIQYSHGLINKNNICAIKYIDRQNRIVINFSHSTTSAGYDGTERITSKFMYLDFDTSIEYKNFKDYINAKIGIDSKN